MLVELDSARPELGFCYLKKREQLPLLSARILARGRRLQTAPSGWGQRPTWQIALADDQTGGRTEINYRSIFIPLPITSQQSIPFLSLFYNFTKIKFKYQTIYSLKVYNSATFSLFAELCTHHPQLFGLFHYLKKKPSTP